MSYNKDEIQSIPGSVPLFAGVQWWEWTVDTDIPGDIGDTGYSDTMIQWYNDQGL